MIAYLDCSTGVSGDKFLGALLDAGERDGSWTAADLQSQLSALAPEALVRVERVRSHGISAVGIGVGVGAGVEAQGATAHAEPSHRTWNSIRELLGTAALPSPVRDRSLRAFAALAQAEAQAHGVDADDVHFHEVGALDSILDVVGTCAGLHALGIELLVASPVAVGGGTVVASHGVLPVPAPATAALLAGVPTLAGPSLPDGSAPGELTTPTGAALLRACADRFGAWPAMTPHLVGYGAGTRDIGRPNVCRIVIGEPSGDDPALATEAVVLLESNIDHISPEAAAFAADQLLSEGALDVWTAPISMKKGRAAFALSVLTHEGVAEQFAARMVTLTGTLGVRRTSLERYVADRSTREVETPYGPVRVKLGAGRARPEADDVARIARENGVSFSAAEAEIGAFLAQETDGA